MRTYYVGMDVHRASIVIVVLNGAGKVVERITLQTSATAVRSYLQRLKGKVYLTFEEGIFLDGSNSDGMRSITCLVFSLIRFRTIPVTTSP
jgi:hypothetical protein